MADEQCVCGRGREAHYNWELEHHFVLCLPWPDSAGWWWYQEGECAPRILHALATARVIRVGGLGSYWTRKELRQWQPSGTARFVKLLEANPFTAKE